MAKRDVRSGGTNSRNLLLLASDYFSMLHRDDMALPATEQLDFYWDLFEKLVKGLKALTNINTAAQKESTLAGKGIVTAKS